MLSCCISLGFELNTYTCSKQFYVTQLCTKNTELISITPQWVNTIVPEHLKTNLNMQTQNFMRMRIHVYCKACSWSKGTVIFLKKTTTRMIFKLLHKYHKSLMTRAMQQFELVTLDIFTCKQQVFFFCICVFLELVFRVVLNSFHTIYVFL